MYRRLFITVHAIFSPYSSKMVFKNTIEQEYFASEISCETSEVLGKMQGF